MPLGKKAFGADTTYNLYATAQTNTAIYTPTTGHSLRVQGYILTTDSAMTVTLKVGTRTFARFYLAANSGANLASVDPITFGTANETLNITTSTSGNVAISAWGYED